VQAYLRQHAWGNATAADLWQALDQASGTNVSAAMTTFLDQPGVPFLRVVPAPGGLRLTQSRATPYGVSQPAVRWNVPVTLKWSDGKTVRSQRVLLTDESTVVKLPATPCGRCRRRGPRLLRLERARAMDDVAGGAREQRGSRRTSAWRSSATCRCS